MLKNGHPVFIGRSVKMIKVTSDQRKKRRALKEETFRFDMLGVADSRGFLAMAEADPVTFTYSLSRYFQKDAKVATKRLCDFALFGDSVDVLNALEIVLFDASPKINAMCPEYIVAQVSYFVSTDPELVRRTIKKMITHNLPLTLKIMRKMYESSPYATKRLAKNLISPLKLQVLKMLVKPVFGVRL